MTDQPQVLVVGGGPGGAAAGYWLSRDGVSVTVVEKKKYPRDKTCGDGLTPRAIHQLLDMGYEFDIPQMHRINGLRAYAGDMKIEIPWPQHTIYPNWGGVIRRADLDMQVAQLSQKQGAVIRDGTEAVAIVEDGELVGAELRAKNEDGSVDTEIVRPDIIVIADGSLSRFGRQLGTYRRRDYPYGMAVRGYYESPNSKDDMLESQLHILDKEGRAMPGYGWIFPLGDGTINIGAGVLSTFKGWKGINTSRILESYISRLPDYWQVTTDSQLTRPVGGKLPMAFSVGPKVGRNWIAIGDASGAVNPFNGEGIDYAYETGRLAAGFIKEALATGDMGRLKRYEDALEDEYGDYHRVARAFVIAVGNPAVMKTLTSVGIRSKPLMEWVLKVMANLLEPEEYGMAERVYHAIEKIVKIGPEPAINR
ncbi:MAG: geranylgeranyl reductase family protein [Acidimicrobiia bacterium]|nr:geranylgeranyl reductase family protein [Acidimicrobiia bacterium]